MNEELRKVKQVIRAWIRAQYTDERLAEVLAFAQDGKFGYQSCCCLVGAATATHPLAEWDQPMSVGGLEHLILARLLPLSAKAEFAFNYLGCAGEDPQARNHLRQRRIIPILKAEIRRRDRLAQALKMGRLEISEVNKGELVI